MKFDTERLLNAAVKSARIVGTSLKTRIGEVIVSEGKDIKIDADFFAHQVILENLKETGIQVLSEEDAVHDFNSSTKWIVDPLDGSINFLRGIPNCVVSIGLMVEGEPIIGVVYDFYRDEMFTGVVGRGAWINGEDIHTSNIQEKNQAIIMTGFPSYTNYSTEALKKYVSEIKSYKKVRIIGSAALSLAYVASGRADAYFEKDIKIWDVCGGLALVKSAGGNHNNPVADTVGGCTAFASNKYIAM